MDSNFTIKPRVGVPKTYTRGAVTIREAADTEIDPASAVGAAGDGGHPQRDTRQELHQDLPQDLHHDLHHDHPPHDVVIDPQSREVINRENDVRTLAAAREHPDQALLRQRAYRALHTDAEPPAAAPEPHANIKA